MGDKQPYKPPNQARYPKAIRPRFLRSKSGCLGCRIRRKKCDEQKPACKSCKKQQLICAWPNGDHDIPQSHGFAWQINLKAGGRVSKTPISVSEPCARQLLPHETSQNIIKDASRDHDVICDLGWPGVPISLQGSHHFHMLIEHYVKITSHTLTGRENHTNPFLSPTLELASADNLVMHAVLAVSGIHCQHLTKDPDVLVTTYKHYGTVLKGLKYALTHWVERTSPEKSLSLLLVAILMCMYEALGGNDNGAMSLHVRAAREFCSHLITREPMARSLPLAGILFEAYAYFAALSHLERRALELMPDQDPIISDIDCIKTYQTFGSYMGCAYQLYELIPTISRLVLYEKRSISRNDDPKLQALYEDTKRAVADWTPGEHQAHNYAETMAGMIVQKTLLMLLHECRIVEGQGPQHVMRDIQPLIEETMSLIEIISKEPVSCVLAWPMMITGSMMVEKRQRHRLLSLFRTHHTHTALAEQMVRLLNLVWEDDDKNVFGITGLGTVAKQHKTYMCYA